MKMQQHSTGEHGLISHPMPLHQMLEVLSFYLPHNTTAQGMKIKLPLICHITGLGRPLFTLISISMSFIHRDTPIFSPSFY